MIIAPKGLLYKRALISLFVRCLSVSVRLSGQKLILPRRIWSRDTPGNPGVSPKMYVLDPLGPKMNRQIRTFRNSIVRSAVRFPARKVISERIK